MRVYVVDRPSVAWRRWLQIALLQCIAVLLASHSAAQVEKSEPVRAAEKALGSPWLRFDADRIVSPAAQPPHRATGWQPVTWPETWRAPERYRQGTLGWYRFPIRRAAQGDGEWAVYLWRYSMNAQVWMNDTYLGSGGSFDEPVARNWNRPLLVPIPAAAWREDGNVLYVRLRVYPGFGHLAPPLVGPRSELEPDYRARTFAQITLTQLAFAIALMATILGGTLWLVLRDESIYAWFALMCGCFSVFCLNQFIAEIPVSARTWWTLTHSVIEWFAVGLVCFIHRLFGVQRRWWERVVAAYAVLATLFFASVELPVLARWNPLVHGIVQVVHFYCLALLSRRAWNAYRAGASDLEAFAFALFLVVLISTSLSDQLLNSVLVPTLWSSYSYSSQLVVPLLFLAIVVHLALRLARTLERTRQANIELESRVAAARTEIERAYAEREEFQRAHAAAGERERIYRDLHDDLGARLLSLVYAARDDNQAELARGALAQMRSLVSAAKLPSAPLSDCAEDWRLETELRAEEAGYDVGWHVDGDTVLSGVLRLHLERILRELTSNVVQHAGGQRIDIRIAVTAQGLTLCCVDDGKGMPRGESTESMRRGNGVEGVRRRVAELGGVAVWSSPGVGGTRVDIGLPLRSVAH